METIKKQRAGLFSVMCSFLAMGFYDLIGVASNYVKSDFNLSDTTIGTFSFLLFLSFLLFSIPTSQLMSRIGQKNTVILSMVLMGGALGTLLASYTFTGVLLFFLILGVGITLIQVAASPLLANIVSGKKLASALTLGQFVKALGSFAIPFMAAWSVSYFGTWTGILPVIIGFGVFTAFVLFLVPIKEQRIASTEMSVKSTLTLLRRPIIRITFFAMLCHVGIDVGMNIYGPQLLMEQTGCSVEVGTYANSVYFLLRTIGCFMGSILLSKLPHRIVFNIGCVLIGIGILGLLFSTSLYWLYFFVGLVGIGNSNVFPIFVSRCLLSLPNQKNEVSALMIMGLFGGAIFPFFMGVASDLMASQIGAFIVLALATIYMSLWNIFLPPKTL